MVRDRRFFRGKATRHPEDGGPRIYLEHYLIALIWLATILIAIGAVMT